MWRSRRRPDIGIVEKIGVDERPERDVVAKGRYAAYCIARQGAHISGIRTGESLADHFRGFPFVHPILAGNQKQVRGAGSRPTEDERFDDLANVATAGGGGFLGGARAVRHGDDFGRKTKLARRFGNALRIGRQWIVQIGHGAAGAGVAGWAKNRKASRIPADFGTVCSWFGSILSGFPHIDEIAGRSGPERGAAPSPLGRSSPFRGSSRYQGCPD